MAFSGDNDQVTFRVYRASLTVGLVSKYTRTFNFPTVLTDADGAKSIHPKFYYTGDFNGDGKTGSTSGLLPSSFWRDQ